MPTTDVPNLDASLLLYDQHVPTTIARTAQVIAADSKDAPNGVAALDASGHLLVDDIATGASQAVIWNGTAWPATRPTARTDVKVIAYGPTATAAPTWLLATDSYETWD